MDDLEFSAEFCRFIQTTIPAVDAAELLLLFHSAPQVWLTPEGAAEKMRPGTSAGEIGPYLAAFESRGMLSREENRYRYRPVTPQAEFVDTLAQAYTQRPVTLVRIIYALRDSKIQSFADAFELRRR